MQENSGWILQSVWDSEGMQWVQELEEEEDEKMEVEEVEEEEERKCGLQDGPYACHWKWTGFEEENSYYRLPPLKNQYFVYLSSMYIGDLVAPPEYVSDYTPGLQGLSCNRVYVPDLKDLHRLRYLKLEDIKEKKSIMNQISSLTNLRQLMLNEIIPEEVPISWRVLVQLEELKIFNVSGLSELLKHLSSLKRLSVYNGPENNFPSSIGSLTSLQTLFVCDISKINNLLSSLGSLSSLQTLNLSCCNRLTVLPSSLGNLSSLQKLKLICCDRLKMLPTSLGFLSSLQLLDLSYCFSLEALPSSLGNLSTLQVLDLKGCASLKEFPCSIRNFSSLKILNISNCLDLKKIPSNLITLSSLETLDLTGCSSLRNLTSSLSYDDDANLVDYR